MYVTLLLWWYMTGKYPSILTTSCKCDMWIKNTNVIFINTVIFDDLSTNNNNHGDKKSANQDEKPQQQWAAFFFSSVEIYS